MAIEDELEFFSVDAENDKTKETKEREVLDFEVLIEREIDSAYEKAKKQAPEWYFVSPKSFAMGYWAAVRNHVQ